MKGADGKTQTMKLGALVKGERCPVCNLKTEYNYRRAHVYVKCEECGDTICSLANHAKKHERERFDTWQCERGLTRLSAYALPALGDNPPIVGTPSLTLREVVGPKRIVYSVALDDSLKFTTTSFYNTPLWKIPTDVAYIAL